MKTKKQKLIITVLILSAAIFSLIKYGLNKFDLHIAQAATPPSSDRSVSTLPHVTQPSNPVMTIAEVYLTPIEFYGKVVDQYNKPIPDAEVKVSVNNRHFLPSTNNFTLKTDANGDFAIKDQRGASVSIDVSHKEYMQISPGQLNITHSIGLFDYAIKDDKGNCYKDPQKPTYFMLFKVGETQDIHHIKLKNINMPMDGTPYVFCLDEDKKNGTHKITFTFKSDYPTFKEMPDNPYNWQFSATIPGGGFHKRKSHYDFIAPETGYQETLSYAYTSHLTWEQWKGIVQCNYFVKFSDGFYGRVKMEADAGSSWTPISLETWLCKKPQVRDTTTGDIISTNFGED
jgi:hypothetical protein